MFELKNGKHERFAVLVAEGMTKTKAYGKVYPEAGVGTAHTMSAKLANRADIAERIAELQEQNATEVKRALGEKFKFLKAVALTPYEEVDETSPLVRSVRKTDQGVAYTLWDRVAAVKMYSKLKGDLDAVAVPQRDTLSEAMARIRARPYVPVKGEEEG
ncbi:hypothetical protein BH09VER1_BH09VER1_30560 [soil metagenome]